MVTVSVSGNRAQVSFVGDNGKLICRLNEGHYVDIQRVIPTESATTVTATRKALIEALKACEKYAKDAANTLRCEVADGTLTLSANAPEVGTRRAKVAVTVTGEAANSIALNVRYLLDTMASITTDLVTLDFKTPASPAVVVPVGLPYTVKHVVMPMYLANR
jgi:DNA polymerase-3 subunit beta